MEIGVVIAFGLLIVARFYGAFAVLHITPSFINQFILVCISIILAIPVFSALVGDGNIVPLFAGGGLQLDLLSVAASALVEAVFGAILVLPFVVTIQAIAMFARASDTARGMQIAEQLSPHSRDTVSPLENFILLAIPTVILVTGGYQIILSLLYQSVSPGLFPIVKHLDSASIGEVFHALSRHAVFVLEKSLTIAAPIFLISVILDISSGMISRSLGRLNVTFEIMPIKLVFGLLIWVMIWEIAGDEWISIIRGGEKVSLKLLVS